MTTKIIIFVAALLLLGVHTSVSQNEITDIVELFDEGIQGTMQYRLLKPIDYDANRSYPLVICLSGGAGRGTDNIRQLSGSKAAQVLATQDMREKHPAFVLVPQCPPGSDWGRTLGKAERQSLIKRGRNNQPSVASLVFEIISSIENKYSIDTNRRYLTGQSMGGSGTWHFLFTHPHMFAAAIVVCGGGNPGLAEKIKHIPLWVFHGVNDDKISVEFSRNMVAALKNSGGDPQYNEFPETGHNSWHRAFETPGLIDWLFEQTN